MRYLALFIFPALVGCNALGGIQPDLAGAVVQNAGAGCIKVDSLLMGSGRVTFANDTKGAIKNGSIFIDPNTCAITINNAQMNMVMPVQTTTTGSSTTTTVTVPR